MTVLKGGTDNGGQCPLKWAVFPSGASVFICDLCVAQLNPQLLYGFWFAVTCARLLQSILYTETTHIYYQYTTVLPVVMAHATIFLSDNEQLMTTPITHTGNNNGGGMFYAEYIALHLDLD